MRVLALIFTTVGSVCIGASVSTTGTFTLPGDEPFSYELTATASFSIDHENNRVFLTGSTGTDVPELPPISHTTTTSKFVPGEFPNPGRIIETVTTRITEYDQPLPAVITGFNQTSGYRIQEDCCGFFFRYQFWYITDPLNPLRGQTTTLTSIDGADPTTSIATFASNTLGGIDAKIRINPDFSMSHESGSMFTIRGAADGVHFFFAPSVVPEPSTLALCAWPLLWLCLHRRITTRRAGRGPR